MKPFFGLVGLLLGLACCQQKKPDVVLAEETIVSAVASSSEKQKLSDYSFFTGSLKNLEPADGVVEYALNSPLFSDYAFKKRFVKIPPGQKAKYHPTEVLDFPEGTILIKNFYYPADFKQPQKSIRLLETRLLILEKSEWRPLSYIWNDEQTDAFLEVAGKSIDVSWTHYDRSIKKISYSVPNLNQCKGCHLKGDKVMPIGPSARQLNGVLPGENKIQLAKWKEASLIENLPPLEAIPRLANYENEKESINLRARAWLEINCAHCHRSDGSAKTSGLHLLASINQSSVLGVGKAPVAAGKGSGGRLYGIVPGKPYESILQFRIESTHPGIMMPEVGRKLVHTEGVELVRKWIAEMK
ncbi:MAG: hypothetical protein LW721_08715 [Flammeovirgaceae bacterium]|jgi:uncharacterized repeat protein (TIGR03806 family)|nr:hypothetical protein [Flammeovirgaceae bacterium]